MAGRGYKHSISPHKVIGIQLTEEELTELREIAERTDRSISWIIQEAWRLAYPTLRNMRGAGRQS